MGFSLKSLTKFIDPNAPAKEANKFERERLEKMLAMIQAESGRQGVQFGKAKSQMRSALPVVRKAAMDARANTALVADKNTRLLREQEKAAMDAARQGVFRSGGAAGNTGNLVSRGVRSDTTRALLGLDQLFADNYARIAQGEANQLGTIYGGLADLDVGQSNASTGLTGLAVQSQGSQQYFPSQGLAGWLKLGGDVAKMVAGFGGI